VFSGGNYEEVARWLENFVRAHAKQENLRVEAVVDAKGAREGQSYGVRLRLGEGPAARAAQPRGGARLPRGGQNRGVSRGAAASRNRVRALAREFSTAGSAPLRSA